MEADSLVDGLLRRPPRLTASLPGLGGELKTETGDFIVEEIPAYEPVGEGEHLYLWIEKEDVGGDWLLKELARCFRVNRNDIGVAGLKDRRAITRQWVSLPAVAEPLLPEATETLHAGGICILKSERHLNKLRTGHLRGNRFDLLLRNVHAESEQRAIAIADRIRETGCPNPFGTQRFGFGGETLLTGLRLLSGDMTPSDLPRAKRKFLLRLSLSAVQSALFNQVLARRMERNWLATPLAGDVLKKTDSGGVFVVTADDLSEIPERLARREVVSTGPLFGPKMKEPTGVVAELEENVLADHGMEHDAFAQFQKLTPGSRRPLIVHVSDLTTERVPEGQRFRFTLPPGAYATTLLDEFMANES